MSIKFKGITILRRPSVDSCWYTNRYQQIATDNIMSLAHVPQIYWKQKSVWKETNCTLYLFKKIRMFFISKFKWDQANTRTMKQNGTMLKYL